MKPTHVLSIVGALPFGGDENRLVSMVQSIDPRKFRFSVVVMPQVEGYDRLAGTMRPVLEAAGIKVYQLEHPKAPAWLPRPGRGIVKLIRKIRAVAKMVREHGIDLVDARMDGGMLVGIPASLAAGKPSASTLYFTTPLSQYPFWRLVQWLNLNLSSAVITDSSVRQAEIRQWIWRRPSKVWNIPNGPPIPRPTRAAAEVREELGIPRNAKVIAQIAALVPYKGPMILLEAARKVLAHDANAYVLMIGYCREEQEFERQLRAKLQDSGLGHRVRIQAYPGPIGDVWQVVDIHVHASTFDSMPNAILEGMALGKPAVVTAIGGIPDAVEHEKTGLVVKPQDPEAIADALLRLLKNPDEAQRFGAAAQARYEARYRPESMARALEDCFRSVLHKKGGPHD